MNSVVVFPGAGSFGVELRPLLRELEPAARLARYPGRFGRDFGIAAGSFDEIVRSCVAQVCRWPARPLLVGHSFGAYVAFAAAAGLEELGTEVAALVVVGANAPALLAVPQPAAGDGSDPAAYLDEVDPGLGSKGMSDEWRDVVRETGMQDLRLLREFRASDYPRVACPVFAARGETDPLTSTAGVGRWADSTVNTCAHRVFPGGHSDLLHSGDFASWLREVRG